MKQSLLYFMIIGALLITSGCVTREDIKPGETMFKESSATFDPEDGKFKIPFDIPKAEKEDQSSEASTTSSDKYLK